MLIIRLTKISPTHHRFEIVRDDGSSESVELETKSFLFHDLIHYAYESEAKLEDSFYGKLAKGLSYKELTEGAGLLLDSSEEITHTERIVGPLTGVMKVEVSPSQFLSGLHNIYQAFNEEVPKHLSEDFVDRVSERMRKMMGQWQKLPFGQTMELVFEV